jgi:hypothetical protein
MGGDFFRQQHAQRAIATTAARHRRLSRQPSDERRPAPSKGLQAVRIQCALPARAISRT